MKLSIPPFPVLVDQFRLKWWLCPLLILVSLFFIPWFLLFGIAILWLAIEFTLTVFAVRSLLRRRA
ncbi:MAG: hypothetical protein AAFV88_12455 [Planctomycetota bacterium]